MGGGGGRGGGVEDKPVEGAEDGGAHIIETSCKPNLMIRLISNVDI